VLAHIEKLFICRPAAKQVYTPCSSSHLSLNKLDNFWVLCYLWIYNACNYNIDSNRKSLVNKTLNEINLSKGFKGYHRIKRQTSLGTKSNYESGKSKMTSSQYMTSALQNWYNFEYLYEHCWKFFIPDSQAISSLPIPKKAENKWAMSKLSKLSKFCPPIIPRFNQQYN